jgi:hypothetical protein
MTTNPNTTIDELPANVIDGIEAGLKSRASQFEDRVWQIMREEFGDLRLRETVGSLEYLKTDIIRVSYGPELNS